MAQVRGSGRPDTERDERSGRVHRAVLLGGLTKRCQLEACTKKGKLRPHADLRLASASLQTDTLPTPFATSSEGPTRKEMRTTRSASIQEFTNSLNSGSAD